MSIKNVQIVTVDDCSTAMKFPSLLMTTNLARLLPFRRADISSVFKSLRDPLFIEHTILCKKNLDTEIVKDQAKGLVVVYWRDITFQSVTVQKQRFKHMSK